MASGGPAIGLKRPADRQPVRPRTKRGKPRDSSPPALKAFELSTRARALGARPEDLETPSLSRVWPDVCQRKTPPGPCPDSVDPGLAPWNDSGRTLESPQTHPASSCLARASGVRRGTDPIGWERPRLV